MARRCKSFTLLLLPLLPLVLAQTLQQCWTFASAPDFSQTLPIGVPVVISWNASVADFFPLYEPDANVQSVDLWVTDFSDHIFGHKIGSKFSVNRFTLRGVLF